MAANMSLAMDDTDKVKILYEDCRLNGIAVLPPDVNASEYRFAPTDAKTIRYGLGGIKGSGQGAIEDILRAREDGRSADLFDFCERVDRRQVNRRTIEALIRAGAFDSLHDNRGQLLASVSIAMEAAEQKAESANQVSLFDLMGDAAGDAAPAGTARRAGAGRPSARCRRKSRRSAITSGHLFDARRDEVRRFVKGTLAGLEKEVQGNRRRLWPRRAGQDGGGRHHRHPHADDPARQDADRAARRRHGPDRDDRVQRTVRRQPAHVPRG